MSLQVWLPLCGNLDNFGLTKTTVTATDSVIIDNNGKIGKCYLFDSENSAIQFSESSVNNFNGSFSFSLWLNIISFGTSYDTYLYCGKGDSPLTSYIFGLLRNNTNSNITFVISNGTTATNTALTSSTLSMNTWYHIACTYEQGKMKLYLNGELDKEITTTITPNYELIQKCFIGALNSSSKYQTNSKINDVRIYNHCLSQKEIKEISKGLCLHWKLDKSIGINKEIDCGIANIYNGDKIGEFSYSLNTPRYSTASIFKDSNKIITSSPTAEIKTLSIWVYIDSSVSNGVVAVDFNSKLGLGFYDSYIIVSCISSTITYTYSKIKNNNWNHFVIIKDSSKNILYINGELAEENSSKTDAWSQSTQELILGCRNNGNYSYFFNGTLSDFRLYSTTLPEKDVLELYNTAALIDKDGNFSTYELKEI